jgi:ABC-type transporter Mla maintaining outer membrane lipid asymmetry ATPase subunit MlaF
MADESPIRLVGPHKSFGPQVVLDGVSPDIARGQITVVMGPSGIRTGFGLLFRLAEGAGAGQ